MNMRVSENTYAINRAFTKQSDGYDSYDASNAILIWMRRQVRNHVLAHLKKDARILELNAGTGLDAVFFAEQGHRVYATDLSDGMVRQIQKKITDLKLEDALVVKQCSYTELNFISDKGFDYVFSNFGGLNCIPDLTRVIRHLPPLLKPGAIITFVLMPPVCPWEISKILKGKWKEAFRRFNKKGAPSHLEGEYFPTFYFTPAQAVKAFGPDFKKINLQGLATFSPPPYAENFTKKYSSTYKLLTWLDEKTSRLPLCRSYADHFILTMQYNPTRTEN
jgi:ubiquinone/menaquinone biosynthesis C-methylase UbiE